MKYVKSIFNRYFYVSLIFVVLGAGSVGFALGIYFLPIIIASEGATEAQIVTAKENIIARASFIRDLKGSQFALG